MRRAATHSEKEAVLTAFESQKHGVAPAAPATAGRPRVPGYMETSRAVGFKTLIVPEIQTLSKPFC